MIKKSISRAIDWFSAACALIVSTLTLICVQTYQNVRYSRSYAVGYLMMASGIYTILNFTHFLGCVSSIWGIIGVLLSFWAGVFLLITGGNYHQCITVKTFNERKSGKKTGHNLWLLLRHEFKMSLLLSVKYLAGIIVLFLISAVIHIWIFNDLGSDNLSIPKNVSMLHIFVLFYVVCEYGFDSVAYAYSYPEKPKSNFNILALMGSCILGASAAYSLQSIGISPLIVISVLSPIYLLYSGNIDSLQLFMTSKGVLDVEEYRREIG